MQDVNRLRIQNIHERSGHSMIEASNLDANSIGEPMTVGSSVRAEN